MNKRESLISSTDNDIVVSIIILLCYVLHIAGTIAGLRDEIRVSTKALIEAKTSTVSVSSGCELFVRFITLTSKLEEKVRVKACHDIVVLPKISKRVKYNLVPRPFHVIQCKIGKAWLIW